MPHAGTLFPPLDNELGLVAYQQVTPRMQACLVRFGTNDTFGHAAAEMKFHHQLEVSKECVRLNTLEAGRVYERVQADPVANRALSTDSTHPAHANEQERQMVSVDAAKVLTTTGTGEWRDVKTLTITEVSPNGRTYANTYFSRLSECSVFAQQCQVEVQRRQLKRRRPGQVCALNDGADWIPEVVTACRPDAVRILDFYHAAEHLAAAARSVFGENTPAFHAWFVTQRRELRDGDPDRVLEALADLASIHPQHAECINATQGYLLKRRDLIRYVEFKAAAWPMAPCII